MTYGICPLCGSIPVLPKEFRELQLAARPTMILNFLYASVDKKVVIKDLALHLEIAQPTLSVHVSRIRHEFRLLKLPWCIEYHSPSWYVLTRLPDDEDSSAECTEAPNP